MEAIVKTEFSLPGQISLYKGKVRDVYNISDKYLVMVATDRISAFDVVLPKGIPYKGQVLNQIASKFLDATSDIVPNWKIASPDPMVTIGRKAEPLPVEMVIRGYLTGHAWREYRSGKRSICGISLPNGMKENQKFDKPIITPTTKAHVGHDEDISRDEILATNLVPAHIYKQVEEYTFKLFERGTQMAERMSLILVDTKYEFGIQDGKVYLIDEIHTPDSSRYFYGDTYDANFKRGIEQRQLSKEFVRQWLIENGFQGKEGQVVPFMPPTFVVEISERYIELYEHITGERFNRADSKDVMERIENNIRNFLSGLG
jgi:phosphoribosylaminoimidazole-succinocarboxamide synthase